MTVIVVTNTVALVLLSFLVVGLLRSHAEILRRLGPAEEDGGAGNGRHPEEIDLRPAGTARGAADAGRVAGLPPPRSSSPPAADIAGDTPFGDARKLSVRGGGPTLVAFLSSGCLTCLGLWEGLREDREPLPGGARLLVVTKGRDRESPSRLRDLAPADVPVVMSTEAWERYGITMSPYFVFVGPDGVVRSEGAAASWEQVRSLLRDAIDDEEDARARERGAHPVVGSGV
jgi:hypothetical protein